MFSYLYYIVLTATFVYYIANVRQLPGGHPLTLLVALVSVAFATENIVPWMPYRGNFTGNSVYQVYTLLEYAILALIYRKLLDHPFFKRAIPISIWALVILALLNMRYVQPITVLNTNVVILESLMLVMLALSFFNQVRRQLQYDNLLEEGMFWFNSIVLFYFSCSVFIWGFHAMKVYRFTQESGFIYNGLYFLSAMFYTVLAVALWVELRKIRRPNPVENWRESISRFRI